MRRKDYLSICCILILTFFIAFIKTPTASAVNLSLPSYTTLNPFAWGECTWYAWGRVSEVTGISLPNLHNAVDWYTNAANSGISVGTTPIAGSVVVFYDVGSNTSGFGHVAYVESVQGSTMTVSEGGTINTTGEIYRQVSGVPTSGARYAGTIWQQNVIGYIYFSTVHNAEIIANTIPTTMTAGQYYTATITVKNTGTATWTAAGEYALGVVDDGDPMAHSGRYLLGSTDSIGPGQSKVFTISLKAPTVAGEYITDWRMLQQGVEWFGQTLIVNVEVKNELTVDEFVTRFYQTCLNRSPDSAGLIYWVDKLESGEQTGADCAYGFVFSDEFTRLGVSNDKYLDVLYRAFFNREPDSGGYNYWLGQLNDGTSRMVVLAGFVNANEFGTLCDDYGITRGSIDTSDEQIAAFVTRFYEECLGRQPDQDGLDYWVDELSSGASTAADVAYGFVHSNEFQALTLTNQEYLEVLFTAFFDRDPDGGGLAYWLGQLDAGAGRLGVLAGFVNSNEFASLCSEYGIEAGEIDV